MFFRRTTSSLAGEAPASPTHLHDPNQRSASDFASWRPTDSSDGAGGKHRRWESFDFSDAVFDIDHHPVCKSRSRKLSDLGAITPVEPSAGERLMYSWEADAAQKHKQQQQQQLKEQRDAAPPAVSLPATAEDAADGSADAQEQEEQDAEQRRRQRLGARGPAGPQAGHGLPAAIRGGALVGRALA